MDKVTTIEELLNYAQDFAGTLAMSHDFPYIELFKQFGEKYSKLKFKN